MSTPSFAQLFRRSRYTKGGIGADAVDVTKQRRMELFAVAAVGFVVRYDSAFKRHFLRQIDRNLRNPGAFRVVELQAEDESDLRLIDRKGKRLVVVEFKVRAPLNAHQDPGKTAFWTSEKGYGSKLLRDSVGCDRIWFVTIQQEHEFVATGDPPENKRENKQFWFRRLKWVQLEAASTVKESLECDLLDSLGEIGVTNFMERKVKRIRVNSEQVQSVCDGWPVIDVLLRLCQKHKCGPLKPAGEDKLSMQCEAEWVGVYNWMKPSDYCWFGFKQQGKHAFPVVEFGFMREGRGDRARKFLARIKRHCKRGAARHVVVERRLRKSDEWCGFECTRHKGSTLNDYDWLDHVLKFQP